MRSARLSQTIKTHWNFDVLWLLAKAWHFSNLDPSVEKCRGNMKTRRALSEGGGHWRSEIFVRPSLDCLKSGPARGFCLTPPWPPSYCLKSGPVEGIFVWLPSPSEPEPCYGFCLKAQYFALSSSADTKNGCFDLDITDLFGKVTQMLRKNGILVAEYW